MTTNPFVQKGIIRDIRCFYGRKRELRKVFNHLRAEPAQCCALGGDGKTGKSSFLHYISYPAVRKEEGLYSSKHIFVNFDFQHNLEINQSDFWRLILKDISGQIDDPQLSSDIANLCDLRDFSKTTIEELMQTLQHEDFKLYLLLDEFECIEKIPDLFKPGFIAHLRYLTNHYDMVCVVATEVELQDLIPEKFGSPFPNLFASVHLGLFSEDETRDLIEQTMNPVEPSLLDEEPYIVRVAGRHPFLTQVVCYHLFDLKAEKGALTKDDYEKVTEESLTDVDSFFKGDLWPSLTETERQLLTTIAWGQEVDSRVHRVELRRLEKFKQYIHQQDGQLVIFCDLLRRFIREQNQMPVCETNLPPPKERKPLLKYDDFEIHVEQARPGEGYPVNASYLQCQNASGTLSIDLEAIQADLKLILDRGTDLPFMREFGQKLLESIMVGGIQRCFDSAYGQITGGNRGLRIRLCIDPPELASLPWEFLYEKEYNRWLATSSSIALSRYVDDSPPDGELSVQLPLNILLVQSDPTDLSEYGLPRLKDSLKAESDCMWGALGGLIDRGLVTLETSMDATTKAIREKLRSEDKDYHILHFSGHGQFADEEEQQGRMLMQRSDRSCRPIDEDTIVELLKDTGVQLVILNACRTATSSPTQRFVSLVTSLVRSGPRAVVAMQYSFPDEIAQHFMQEFYTSLANGMPVDVSAAYARKIVAIDFDRENRDWATPLLYMRSPDGVIFNIKSVDSPKTKNQQEVSISDELLRDLKNDHLQIMGKQNETLMTIIQARDAILGLTIDVHKNTMRVFLSALDEQETHIVQSIVENIDRKQLTEAEMKEILNTIQQGYKELQKKALAISTDNRVLQETQNLSEVWNSPDVSMGGKLKLSIPIIPQILTYETELSVDVKKSLKGFWKKFWQR